MCEIGKNTLGAAFIALGITLAGLFMYCGIHQISVKDRAVTVKGLSTRDVKADYVVWPLEIVINGNDYSSIYNELNRIEQVSRAYFVEKGFKDEEISMGSTSIDNNWQGYYDHRPEHHYTLRTHLIISTADVDKVIHGQNLASGLLSKGIVLNSYKWDTDYQYNGLNQLKPEMVEEATKNAREVAKKFAADSGSKLGGIRRANQGQFSMESDNNQPWIKHIRVVTTVDYYLR